jgi:hypothetical protein
MKEHCNMFNISIHESMRTTVRKQTILRKGVRMYIS